MNGRGMRQRGFSWRHTPGLPSFTAAILVFLYSPLLILVIYAFNGSRMVTVWQGFSLQWFTAVAANNDIRNAAINSLIELVPQSIAATRFTSIPPDPISLPCSARRPARPAPRRRAG